jgi:gentisate 1,2-dioxygenase
MENYIFAYEYEKNVNPKLNNISLFEKNIIDCDYGITFIDFSELFNVEHKSTTPNLLASFIRLTSEENFHIKNDVENNFSNATSHLFYILNGSCEIIIDNEILSVNKGDILITPLFDSLIIQQIPGGCIPNVDPLDLLQADGACKRLQNKNEELQIYYINDSPLVNYLGNKSVKKIFKTAIYTNDFLIKNLHTLSNPKNNRKGILLSNKDTNKIGVNTITPVLWALYNELPPNTVQRPHKHNSVALDLCIKCSDSENIYTLIGEELDENGNIINPIKVNWSEGGMFITPPGLWHSHNNIGNTFAYILPIQDAGLLLYQRILGIVLN